MQGLCAHAQLTPAVLPPLHARALAGAVAAAGSVLRSRTAAGQPLSASGDLLQSLLAVADAHLVFARARMLSSSVVPAVFDWAVLAGRLREREPVNAALSFLSHLLAAANKVFTAAAEAAAAGQSAPVLEQQAAILQQCLAGHGQQLVRALVLGACDTAPRQLLRALGGVLYQLLQSSLTGDAGRQWLLAALQAPDLPGACCLCVPARRLADEAQHTRSARVCLLAAYAPAAACWPS